MASTGAPAPRGLAITNAPVARANASVATTNAPVRPSKEAAA
jgi:hypothetical protein